LVAERATDGAAKWRADLAEQVAEEALWGELRAGIERQQAAELSGEAADLLAEALVAERAADGAAKWRADLAEQVAEEALWGELRAGIERQQAAELSGETADLLAEALVAERATDGAAKWRADLAEQVAEEAL